MRIHRCHRPLLGLVLLTCVSLHGCRPGGVADAPDDVKVDFLLRPQPPTVGTVSATVKLRDRNDKALRGAAIKLEGNMNHAGMTPVFADAKEVEPGEYRAELELTMGGDWFVLVNARLADGRTLKRKIDVPGVESR